MQFVDLGHKCESSAKTAARYVRYHTSIMAITADLCRLMRRSNIWAEHVGVLMEVEGGAGCHMGGRMSCNAGLSPHSAFWRLCNITCPKLWWFLVAHFSLMISLFDFTDITRSLLIFPAAFKAWQTPPSALHTPTCFLTPAARG